METLIVVTVVLIALAVVLAPLLRREKPAAYARADLEADVARYRAAMRAGTVCARCAEASPPGSRYCMRCGRRIESAAPVRHA